MAVLTKDCLLHERWCMLLRSLDIYSVRRTALNAVLERLTPQELLDRIYALTDLPMICFDAAFHHIAHCYEEPFYFESWVEIASLGVAGEGSIFSFGYLERQESIVSAGRSKYVDTGRCAEHPSVNRAIFRGGELIAYCGTMVEDCPTEQVLELNDILAQALTALICAPESGAAESPDGYILSLDRLSDEHTRLLRRNYPGPYYFVLVSAERGGIPTLEYARSCIMELPHSSLSCIGEDRLLSVLFCDVVADRTLSGLLDELRSICTKIHIKAAISCGFFDPAELPMRRRQAALLLTTGAFSRPDSNVFFFRDMYLDIIAFYSARETSGGLLILPELRRLDKLPDAQRSEYVLTLYQYIFNFRSTSMTADALGVHRNTVLYRIARAEELLGLDLQDDELCERLMFSLFSYASAHGIDLSDAGGDASGQA